MPVHSTSLSLRLVAGVLALFGVALLALPAVASLALRRGLLSGGLRMRRGRPSLIAELVAAWRALCTFRGALDDRLAWHLLGWELRAAVAIALLAKTAWPALPLAAPALATLPPATGVFEVDMPATQAAKAAAVAALRAARPALFRRPASSIRYVPCDFSRGSPADALVAAGFNPREPDTAVLLEGVAPYLACDELRATLLEISRAMAPGTRFAMNVLGKEATRPGTLRARALGWMGEAFRFGLGEEEDPAAVFGPLGFRVERCMDFVEAAREYLGEAYARETAGAPAGRLVFMCVEGSKKQG
ncbi:S-adenosyl-L-methionine-dependent methyltransferase [Hyaloraphidium curvatum]|nr:S-adenosyl-L-methionine-dependent methyltransferase [Hyaloraphidium curvatum]